MFGIELDKLLFVGILIGLIVGPARLVEWRRKLPQMVGRVHALYQQGKAQVTRDLDDMAPDWREYDPRQLHPRRILRELGADVRTAAESHGQRVASEPPMGESPVESMAPARDPQSGRESSRGGDDDIEGGTDTGRRTAHSGHPDESRNDPSDERSHSSVSPYGRREEAAAGQGDQHLKAGVHLSPRGGGEETRPAAEDQVRAPVGMVGRPRDDRGERERDRRGDDTQPGHDRAGSTGLGGRGDGEYTAPETERRAVDPR